MNNTPCNNCGERSATCHAGCVKYSEWKQERDRILTPIKNANIQYGNYVRDSLKKVRRAEFMRRKTGR